MMLMMENRRVISPLTAIAFVVFLTLGFLGCTPVERQSGTPATEPATEKLKILSHGMSRLESGMPVIKGTAKNVSPYTISYAEVEVEFLDFNTNPRGTSQNSTSDLAAGEIWNFEVIFLGGNPENVEQYRIRVGTIR